MLIFILYGILSYITKSQSCLLTARNTLPPFTNLNDPQSLQNGTQAIVTSYQFHCCGAITEWLTYLHVLTNQHADERAYDINFQVWRPTATPEKYNIVGYNFAPSIEIEGNGLAHVIPGNSERVLFMPGDVVGFFTTTRISSENGNSLQLDRRQTGEELWYAQDGKDAALGSGTVIVREDQLISSTQLGPILSVRISTYPCPSSLPASYIASTTPHPSVTEPIIIPTQTPSSAAIPSASSATALTGNTLHPTATVVFTSMLAEHSATVIGTHAVSPTVSVMSSVNSNMQALNDLAIIIIAALGGLLVFSGTLLCIIIVAVVVVVRQKGKRAYATKSSMDVGSEHDTSPNFTMMQNEVYSIGRCTEDSHCSDVNTDHDNDTNSDYYAEVANEYYTDINTDHYTTIDTNQNTDKSTDQSTEASNDHHRDMDTGLYSDINSIEYTAIKADQSSDTNNDDYTGTTTDHKTYDYVAVEKNNIPKAAVHVEKNITEEESSEEPYYI